MSKNKRIAVLFSGYMRDYKYTSHIPIINSIYTDVFIHTWADTGFKNMKRHIDNNKWLLDDNKLIDFNLLIRQYCPVKISVENNRGKLNEFSLINKIDPIFLYSGQAKDDASKYINSQLYSLYMAYKLMCDYENEHNFKYDGIIRLRFDLNIVNIDWTGIFEDIDTNNMFFPHAACNNHKHCGGGGGCLSCDKNIEHDKHTNDICDLWFYGKRDIVAIGCELYLNSLKILEENHEHNLQELEKSKIYKKHGNFVYISHMIDIEEKFVCFYPERLLREIYKDIPCMSSKHLCGKL
jgi:hypothetical protein